MADVTTATTTTEKKSPTVKEQFEARDAQNQKGINTAYDSGLAAQKQGLLDAYNQNTGAQKQQAQDIQKHYAAANYDVGVQNDRNERNLTQFADVRQVNTGMGSQHRLNLGNARANAVEDLAFRQNQVLQENERQQQLMATTYQNQVQAALADNDYKRAAALLDNYNNQKTWQDQQAQILATYGNMDAYKDLYGDDAAKVMQGVWNAQNPEVAYRTGAITAEQYKQITGQYPRGYTPPWSGGWSGWGYGGGGDDDGDGKDQGNLPPDGGSKTFYVYSNGRSVSRVSSNGNMGGENVTVKGK